jgi:hypothetical protein
LEVIRIIGEPTQEGGTPEEMSVAERKTWMSAFGYADEQQPLALEAEFDGARRPRAPTEPDPCDPDRYWEIFSGTD